MRIIEERSPFASTAMGKKKKSRNITRAQSQYDSSDDGETGNCKGSSCVHIAKAVSSPNCRKALKTTSEIQCAGCSKEELPSESVEGEENSCWFCLQCGYQGCGSWSKSNHAWEHHKTPRSTQHCVAVDTTKWVIRCFECDEDIPITSNKNLTNTVSLVKKHLGGQSSSRPNSSEISQLVDSSSQSNSEKPVSTQRQRGSGDQSGGVLKSAPKLKGLPNLGNTCFFNSVMQSLSQVGELSQLLADVRQGEMIISGQTEGDNCTVSDQLGSDYESSGGEEDSNIPAYMHPLTVSLVSGRENSSLTDSLVKLIGDMNSEGPRRTANPGGLFSQICSKVPRFKGYQQQDSHELLRYLLDAMKNEELKRIQSGILSSFNFKQLDEQAKKQCAPRIKYYGQQAKHTTVDSLFGGYLLSTVQCNECHQASQIFEPFLDLSLPIYEERTRHSARKGSKSAACDDHDDFVPVEDRNGPSKHQQKKAARASRKNRKPKGQQVPKNEDTNEIVPGDPTVNGAEAEAVTTSNPPLSDSNEQDTQATAAVDDCDQVPTTVTTVTTGQQSDSAGSSSRAASPKSGYNSDVEDGDQTLDTTAADSALSSSGIEKLKISDSCTEFDCKAQIKEVIDTSLTALCEKPACAPHDCSVLSSLGQFTTPELLTGSNKFACSFCNRRAKRAASTSKDKPKTVYTNAKKQLIIYSPPAILTLHLKRFQQNGYSFNKVNRHVNFSLTLDLAPYCSTLSQGVEAGQIGVNYKLFGVVEHCGRLNNGHYTAYVRQRSSNPKIIKLLQKSLHNRKPLKVILERFAEINQETESRKEMTDRTVEGAEADQLCVNGEIEHNQPEQQQGSQGQQQQPQQIHVQPARWFHISDSHVKEVNEHAVLNSQAYLLFYERVR